MLKVDLKKAFDSIHWDFLEDLLKALHFPHIFTKWIMACVSNVNFLSTSMVASTAISRGVEACGKATLFHLSFS